MKVGYCPAFFYFLLLYLLGALRPSGRTKVALTAQICRLASPSIRYDVRRCATESGAVKYSEAVVQQLLENRPCQITKKNN